MQISLFDNLAHAAYLLALTGSIYTVDASPGIGLFGLQGAITTTSSRSTSSSTTSSTSSSTSLLAVTTSSSSIATNTATIINPSQVASVSTTGSLKFGRLPAGITYYGNPPQITSLVVSDGAVGQTNIAAVAVAEQTQASNDDGQATQTTVTSISVNPTLAAQAASEVGDVASVLNGAAAASNGGLEKRDATATTSAATTSAAITSAAAAIATAVVGPPTTAAQNLSSVVGTGIISNILILSPQADVAAANAVLDGLGTPYTVVPIPQAGVSLPTMESLDGTTGQFSAIVIIAAVSYYYTGYGWASALSASQQNMLFNYQLKYKVRMVQLGVYPTDDLGVEAIDWNGGCCNTGIFQNVTITSTAGFTTAGLIPSAQLDTTGLWHYPAKIVDPTSTTAFLQFGASSDGTWASGTVAGVISNFTSGRQQMSIFLDTASWSLASNVLSHAWFNWATRGVYPGYRRVYFQQQVDDIYLSTVSAANAEGNDFARTRLVPADLDAHISWSTDLASRMNKGSTYMLELGFNGNGNAEFAYLNDTTGKCEPWIQRNDPGYTGGLEFQKVLGTGTDQWPVGNYYGWTQTCLKKDNLGSYFAQTAKLNAFAWVSHTFTHENLDNSTYADTLLEMQYNQYFASTMKINKAKNWSPKGLIPPAITGMHNGDALRAMSVAGLSNLVGDNSRPLLRNTNNFHWPLITTVAANGFAGMQVTPRWPTYIFFDASDIAEDVQEWQWLVGGTTTTIYDLLWKEGVTNVNYLLSLYQDPFMFHQINLRQSDLTPVTVNGNTAQYSLLQMWTETIVQKFNSLVNWPMVAASHDKLATVFANRMARDQCVMSYQNTISKGKITAVTLTPTGQCPALVPVTLPGPVVSSALAVQKEQIGNDPLTLWVDFSYWTVPVTFTLKTPITM